VIHLIYWNRSV